MRIDAPIDATVRTGALSTLDGTEDPCGGAVGELVGVLLTGSDCGLGALPSSLRLFHKVRFSFGRLFYEEVMCCTQRAIKIGLLFPKHQS